MAGHRATRWAYLATVCVGKGTWPGGICLQPGSLRCDAHCLLRTVTKGSVQSSDGFVLSELRFFAEGMTSLAPGANIEAAIGTPS
jgi:hypothetical protein